MFQDESIPKEGIDEFKIKEFRAGMYFWNLDDTRDFAGGAMWN